MRHVSFEPAKPLDTGSMTWIPTGPGKSFRPLRFAADRWSELMRLEPGSAVALHRHTGEVHAFNLAGTREIFGTGEWARPGDDIYGLVGFDRPGAAAEYVTAPAADPAVKRQLANGWIWDLSSVRPWRPG